MHHHMFVSHTSTASLRDRANGVQHHSDCLSPQPCHNQLEDVVQPEVSVQPQAPTADEHPPPTEVSVIPKSQTGIPTLMSASYTNTCHSKSPWKTDHPPLPSNYVVCEKQTRVLTRRLGQTPELLKVYGDIISEQERRGFIDRVIDTNLSENVHYTPHYPVTKDSSTTPIRIVYDCS